MKKRIFIVEDEAIVALELAELLGGLGYEICGRAVRGEAALRDIPAARPDLILMDIELRGNVSGLDVADALRGVHEVPVIFLTAYTDASLVQRATHRDSYAYIVKPFDPRALAATVELALMRQDATVALRQSERQFRAMYEQAGVGVAVVDLATGALTRVNRKYCEIMGYSEAELLGRDFRAITYDADRAHGNDVLGQLVRGEVRELHFEKRYVRKDGQIVWAELSISPLFMPGEAPTISLSIVNDITARKQAESALRASEERYRRLVEESVEGIYDVKPDGTQLRVNPALAAMLGYASPAELAGRTITSLYADPADRRRIWETYRDRETIEGVETVWQTRTGEQLDIALYARVMRDETGAAIGYHGVARDVTEQRQLEAALRLLSTGLTLRTGQGWFDELVVQLASLVGADSAMVGRVDGGVLRTHAFSIDGQARAPIELPLTGTPCARLLEGAELVIPDGVCREYPGAAVLASLGIEGYVGVPLGDARARVTGVVAVMSRRRLAHPERIRSILRLFAIRIQAELERQLAEERFSGVFEFAPDALLIVDVNGRILLANRMAEEILGYSRAELVQRTVEELVPVENRVGHADLRNRFFQEGRTRRMGWGRSRLWAQRANGSKLPVEISLSPLRSSEGDLVVAAIRDVSERVRIEDERARIEDHLRQTQKMESLGTLAGGIAHDFNNILSAISLNLELTRADLEDIGRSAAELADIGTALERARSLVQQILAFSRQQPTRRTITSLAPVIDEAVKLLRATLPATVQLVIEIDPRTPLVNADATQVLQVVMNLATNAWHAIEPRTGHVWIALDGVTIGADDDSVASVGPGRYARLRVRDDGAGMDEDTRARIFEPFFTTKSMGKGTGLGLAVVHGIVTGHGGAIAVDSAVGRGTSFGVFLPEATSRSVEAPSSPMLNLTTGRGHVLFVDDEQALVRAGSVLLQRLGYQVSGFVRAVDALAALRANPARFDLVVTDKNMPDLGGLELAREVAVIRPDLPVVLVTGFQDRADETQAVPNIRATIDKPYTSNTLASVLGSIRTGVQ